MAIENLSTKDQLIVWQCLRASAAYIEDCEKHARLGLEPEHLQKIIAQWPNIDDTDERGEGFLAINNSMNEVCHGFRIVLQDWSDWFDTTVPEIEATYQRWLSLKGISGGLR